MKNLNSPSAAIRVLAAVVVCGCVAGTCFAQQTRTFFPTGAATVQQPNDVRQGVARVALRSLQAEPTPLPTTIPPTESTPLSAPTLIGDLPSLSAPSGVVSGGLCGSGTGDCNYPVVKRKCGPFSLRAQLRSFALCPPCIGSSVATIFEMQRTAAMSEYFVIFMEDWLDETASLNSTGERHFSGILKRFGTHGDPIRIEPIGKEDDVVNVKRKAAIIDLLIAAGVAEPVAKSRVIIGRGRAENLRYSDIEGLVGQSGGVGSFGSGINSGGVSSATQSLGGFGGLFGSGVGGFR